VARRPKIAVVDDEADLREALSEYLEGLGYDVKTAGSVAACDRLLDGESFDLIVLDLNMPGSHGLTYLGRLRDRFDGAVLVLTASTDSVDRITGLETGADDFVVKPVDPQELVARISGILARRGSGRRELIRLERATVDLTASCLLVQGQPPERLGPGEVVLMRVFARRPNTILSRNELIELAPAESLDANDRAIDTRIARLRRKLDTEAIVTVRGHGYMFVPPFSREA
jgi:DNA-binding response OmpR family regulator